MKTKARTIWQGKVGIPDRIVNEALDKGEDLRIVLGDEVMDINAYNLAESIDSRSKQKFADKYGNHPPYQLIYFLWKGVKEQPSSF